METNKHFQEFNSGKDLLKSKVLELVAKNCTKNCRTCKCPEELTSLLKKEKSLTKDFLDSIVEGLPDCFLSSVKAELYKLVK